MSDQELVDLLAYLSSLRQPVSIVGQYHVIGPLEEPSGTNTFASVAKIDLAASVRGPQGQNLAWRRLDANAEGIADLTAMVEGGSDHVAYAYTPVTSPVRQPARLVVQAHASLTIWLNGASVFSTSPTHILSEPQQLDVTLPKGTGSLLIRMSSGGRPLGQATLVTTFVTAEPLSFNN